MTIDEVQRGGAGVVDLEAEFGADDGGVGAGGSGGERAGLVAVKEVEQTLAKVEAAAFVCGDRDGQNVILSETHHAEVREAHDGAAARAGASNCKAGNQVSYFN